MPKNKNKSKKTQQSKPVGEPVKEEPKPSPEEELKPIIQEEPKPAVKEEPVKKQPQLVTPHKEELRTETAVSTSAQNEEEDDNDFFEIAGSFKEREE